ncbi:MAG: hypothetical protein Q9183_002171 [Haloplaca sp. 2 TL-2023]
MLQLPIKPFGTFLGKPGKPLPAGSPRLTPHPTAEASCNISERQVDGIWIYDLSAHEGARNPKRIYYFAGGGFQMPPSPQHWKFCADLCHQLSNTTVSLISCPLAPNSPAPETLPLLVELYYLLMEAATESGERVTFMGDSTGANLALSVPLCAMEGKEGISLESIFLISPVVDLRNINADMKSVAKKDPIQSMSYVNDVAEKWAASWPREDPGLSPLLADLSALRENNVKVHGVTGGFDLMTPDATLFQQRCKDSGVDGEWLEWDKQMHCFPLGWIYQHPESVESKDWIIKVLNRDH